MDHPDAPTLEPVSVEHDGIILSGVGVSEDALRETIDARKAPPADISTEQPGAESAESGQKPDISATPAEISARDESGRFAKPARAQNRIEQLARQKNDEKTAREAAEQRAADLEARLQALEQSRTAPAEAPAAPARPAAPADLDAPIKLASFTDQIGTAYTTYEDALEAFTDARYAQVEARSAARVEADQATRAFQSHVSTVFDQGRKAYPDFDAVVMASRVQFPDAIRRRIAQAPEAHALMYALCKDDALAQRIAAIADPFALGLELARVVTPAAVASPASTARAVSSAPAPYQPVGSGSKTTVPTLDELAAAGDDYDSSGYRERRRAERQQRR